ncbi:MAG: hypothetical protein AAGI48_14000 [Verrucomicrobiota bacterium]
MKAIHVLTSFLLLSGFALGGGSQQMFFGIDIDPGVRGDTFTSRTIPFSTLDGVSADGVGIELDFDFTVDEQMTFTNTGSDGFDIIVRVDYSAVPGPLTELPDSNVKMFPIFETTGVPAGSSVVIDGNTAVYTAHFEDEPDILFNSVRFNFIDPNLPGENITGASIEFSASGPGGSFEVTTPQAPGAVLVDSFTGVDSPSFPLEDLSPDFNIEGTSDEPFTHSVAYGRQTFIFLESGTRITADADTSGTGSMDFIVDAGSIGTFELRYDLGRHDVTHGGLNDQLIIDVTGFTSLDIRITDGSNSASTTATVVNNQIVIPLELASFDGPPAEFDFTRLNNINIETPAPLGPGTYTVEQVAITSSSGPQVLSIKPDGPGPVPSGVGMNYTVLFSEPVTGFNNIFDLDTTTTNIVSDPAPLNLQTSDNTTYTLTLRPRIIDGQTSGTMVAAIDPTGGIIDADSNPLVTPNVPAELVTISASAYQLWAIDQSLTAGVNFGYSQDPDSDDRINGAEFVRNTNPLSADDPRREFFHLTEIEGISYGALTVASRDNRTYFEITDGWLQSDFSGGSEGFFVDVADNIRATDDFSFDFSTSPPTLLDPSIDEPDGLPPLEAGWSWYHFRFEDSVETLGKGFMRTEIEDLD